MSKTYRLDDLATLAKGIVIASPNSLDPIDFIQTRVHHEGARAQILSSMAWYIDRTIVGQLHQLYFDLYQCLQLGGNIDNYNDYLNFMQAKEQRETALVEQGLMEGEGVYSLRRLLLLRQTWHDAALIAPRHVMPTIEQLMDAEKPQKPTVLTREKLRVLAEDEAGDDKELAEELFQELVKREELQAQDRFETIMQRKPILLAIASFIEATGTLQEADFNDLSLPVRKRLVEGMKAAVQQAQTRMTSDRRINVLEFMAIRKELKAVSEQIDEILAHPLYSETPTQASIDEQRKDKSLAARGFEQNDEGKFVRVE